MRKINFISPEAPLPLLATDWLFDRLDKLNLSDFSNIKIILPTRSAARTVNMLLVKKFADCGKIALGGLLPTTPEIFISQLVDDVHFADDFQAFAAGARVLSNIKNSSVKNLLPAGIPPRRDFRELLKILSSLRRELSEAGLDADKVSFSKKILDDSMRWNDIARFENLYRDCLGDYLPHESLPIVALEKLRDFFDKGFLYADRIFVVGVCDPSPQFLKILSLFPSDIVDVAVFADESKSSLFDEWGVPKAEWTNIPLPFPETAVCADVSQQAQIVGATVEAYGSSAADICSIACGESDSSAKVISALSSRGIDAYSPDGIALSELPELELVAAFRDFLVDKDMEAFFRIVRNPCALSSLCMRISSTPEQIMLELDEFRKASRCDTLTSANELFFNGAYGEKFPAAAASVKEVGKILESPSVSIFLEKLCDFIFAGYKFRLESFSDLEKTDHAQNRVYAAGEEDMAKKTGMAADFLSKKLAGFKSSLECGADISQNEALDIICEASSTERIAPKKSASSVPLLDWIEILWSQQPHVILADMNEGIVPQAKSFNAFLPDSERVELGMKPYSQRRARDAYMLYTLVNSRRNGGKVTALVPRKRGDGEPSQASGLLLQCESEKLPERIESLFVRPENISENFPFVGSWKLSVRRAEIPSKLSPTALRAYIACPFRFYLSYIIGAKTFDASSPEFSSSEVGTLMHSVLQNSAMTEDGRSGDASVQKHSLVARFERIVRRTCGKNLSAALMFQFASLRGRLEDAAGPLAELRRDGWNTLCVEKNLANLEIGSFKISMRIDRIDENADGDILIIDYKVKDKMESAESSHKRRIGRGKDAEFTWKDLQLPLYKAAVREIYPDRKILCAHFVIGRSPADTGLSVWDIDDGDMASAMDEAEKICECIKFREFDPNPEGVKFDDYAELFPFAKENLENFLEWSK